MFAVSGEVLFNLSFNSLAFSVVSKMNIYSPDSYLWWTVTLMYELWRSQESLSSWWEASSTQILAMEYILA